MVSVDSCPSVRQDRQVNAGEEPVDRAGRLGRVLLERGLRLFMPDRQPRHHLRASVAVANGPGSSATGGVGLAFRRQPS